MFVPPRTILRFWLNSDITLSFNKLRLGSVIEIQINSVKVKVGLRFIGLRFSLGLHSSKVLVLKLNHD